jgi:hypothetical protein
MSGKTWLNWARSGRVRDILITHGDDRLLKGLVELTVWVIYLHTGRNRQGRRRWRVRIGPQRRRFEFESLRLTADGRPRIVTSFFFAAKRDTPRDSKLPRVPGVWWTEPSERCHWASRDDDDRQAALGDAFASLAEALGRLSPRALEDDHRSACGSVEHEFAPAERAELIELLGQLNRLPATPDSDGGLRHRWTGDTGEASGHQDDWGPTGTCVSAKLHPICRPVRVSGLEAVPLLGLGQDST